MRKETFIMQAQLFVRERRRILEFLSGNDEDYLGEIKAAMAKGALPQYRYATVKYLDAIIGGNKKHYKLIATTCGKELFQKLLDAGLTNID